MLSIAGIFAGQNLTTGKADAWNTHITLVPYSKLCVLAFPLQAYEDELTDDKVVRQTGLFIHYLWCGYDIER